jgi:hypothetical protein
MRPSNIPNTIRREILRRKLADLRVELAGIKGHMMALPTWGARCKTLDKAIKQVGKWEKGL